MPDMTLASVVNGLTWVAIALPFLLCGSCTRLPNPESILDIHLYQTWQVQPGDMIAGRQVLGGLGDLSIALNGNSVYAPFRGKTQLDKRHCVIFSSPEVPAYLFRFCGLSTPHIGDLNQGEAIGNGSLLQFATLRKQPNGTWAIVEPAKAIVARTLIPS